MFGAPEVPWPNEFAAAKRAAVAIALIEDRWTLVCPASQEENRALCFCHTDDRQRPRRFRFTAWFRWCGFARQLDRWRMPVARQTKPVDLADNRVAAAVHFHCDLTARQLLLRVPDHQFVHVMLRPLGHIRRHIFLFGRNPAYQVRTRLCGRAPYYCPSVLGATVDTVTRREFSLRLPRIRNCGSAIERSSHIAALGRTAHQ